MYSDFYEIPLPALRFEKVEETDTKKWKVKTTPKRNDAQRKAESLAQQSQETPRRKKNDANDAQRKADSLVRKRHAEKKLNDANQIRTEDLKIRKSSHLL